MKFSSILESLLILLAVASKTHNDLDSACSTSLWGLGAEIASGHTLANRKCTDNLLDSGQLNI